MEKRRHILLVDDDAMVLRSVSRLLSRSFHVVSTTDSVGAVTLCQQLKPDLLITDLEMPHLDGTRLIAAIQAALGDAAPPAIVLTASITLDVPGAVITLQKPGDVGHLIDVVRAILDRTELPVLRRALAL